MQHYCTNKLRVRLSLNVWDRLLHCTCRLRPHASFWPEANIMLSCLPSVVQSAVQQCHLYFYITLLFASETFLTCSKMS